MVNNYGETPLMLAAREGKLHLIRYAYEKYGNLICNLDAKNNDGWTAFFYAAINGFVSTVEYLGIYARINCHTTDRFKRNALHWAARFNNLKMVEKLIDLDLNHNAIDIEG